MHAMTALLHIKKFTQARLTVTAPHQGLYDITGDILAWLEGQTVTAGLLTLYLRHTSASLLIQENEDPDVLRDLEDFFAAQAPEDTALYRHDAEGADDMPAHIKGALTQSQLNIPVRDGSMLLGTWQGVFLFEHRRRPRPRDLVLHLIGE
jgi:secondary thiamine-phosphate synthase enzyme